MLKSVTAVPGLVAVAVTLFLAGRPAIAENTVANTPEAVTTSQLPPGFQQQFQSELEEAESQTGATGRSRVINEYIQDFTAEQRTLEEAGQTPPPELGMAVEALQRLGAYDDARIAANGLLTPEQRVELKKDWEAATTMAGRERAVLGRMLQLHQDISQAEAFNRQADDTAEIPTDQMRAAAEALRRLIWTMATATSPVPAPARAATEEDGEPDRRQGDARSQIDRQNVIGDLRTRGGPPVGRPPAGQGTMAVRPPVQPPRQGPIILRIPGQ